MYKWLLSIFLLSVVISISCSDEVNQVGQDTLQKQDATIDIGFICRNKNDCPSGKDCINGKCVDVEEDTGFDAGFDAGDTGNGGKYCTKDEECPQNYKCNLSNNTCEEIKEPKVCLTENEIDFGYVQYGQSKEKCVVMTNCGNADLSVTGVDFGSNTSSAYQFKAGQERKKTLKPNSSDYLEICVIIVPNSEEAPQGTVEVYTNAEPPKVVIPLKSQYKGSADLVFLDDTNKKIWPDGNTSTFKVDFGLVGPGNKKSLKFKIANATDGDKPLLIKTLDKFAPQFSGRFYDISDDTKDLTLPIIVGPSQTIGLELIYAPTQRSPKDQGNLLIETNDFDIDNNGTSDNGKLMIECSGVAEFPPDISVDPLSIDFGEVQKGVKNPPKRKILIVNTADPIAGQTLKVNIKLTDLGEDSFSLNPIGYIEIPAGYSKEVDITFCPTATDRRTNTVQIKTNVTQQDKEEINIPLEGIGIDPNMVVKIIGDENQSDVIDFGEVKVNTSLEKFIQVQNSTSVKNSDLVVQEPEIITQDGTFSYISSKSFVNGYLTLPQGDSFTITVKYSPKQVGNNSTVLRIRSNDEENPLKDIVLTGRGLDYNGFPIAIAKIVDSSDPKKGYFEKNIKVLIDGSDSKDQDIPPGDTNIITKYIWSMEEKPQNSQATLSRLEGVTTDIIVDTEGIYKIGLKVIDDEGFESTNKDIVTIVGISKENLLISTSRNTGLKGFLLNYCWKCLCGDCNDYYDLRYEFSSLIVFKSIYKNLEGYTCGFKVDDPQDPKNTCKWQNLGEVILTTYCNGNIFKPDYILNPLEVEYNSAPIDENLHEYIYRLEYIDDSICSGTSSLNVRTDFKINGKLVKTIESTLNAKGDKKDIAKIKRQFGKFEIIEIP